MMGHEYDGPVQILPVQILPVQILWEWETKMAERIALVDDDQNIRTSVSMPSMRGILMSKTPRLAGPRASPTKAASPSW